MTDTDRFTGREYVVSEQYKDATNLQARMQLNERFSVNERGWHPWVFDQLPVNSLQLDEDEFDRHGFLLILQQYPLPADGY